jgi:hypothetical protein
MVQHVFVHGVLRWWGSHRCAKCSHAVEEDGLDDPPERYRSAILEQDGPFALSIEAEAAEHIRALKALRGVIGFPLAAVGRLRARLPGPILSGTRGEMDWLAHVLEREGLRATITTGSVEDLAALRGR